MTAKLKIYLRLNVNVQFLNEAETSFFLRQQTERKWNSFPFQVFLPFCHWFILNWFIIFFFFSFQAIDTICMVFNYDQNQPTFEYTQNRYTYFMVPVFCNLYCKVMCFLIGSFRSIFCVRTYSIGARVDIL